MIRTTRLDAMSLAAAPVIEYLCYPGATDALGAGSAGYLRRRAANWFKVSTETENPIAA